MSRYVLVAALALASLVSGAVSFRSLNGIAGASSSDESGARIRLRGSYWGAVWGIVGALAGLGATAAAWNLWLLLAPILATWSGLISAGFLHGARMDSWYQRYRMDRIMEGLPPRRWWDGRLD